MIIFSSYICQIYIPALKTHSNIFILICFSLFIRYSWAQCDTINLGNDTTLCEGYTMLLDAGSGFTSYSWNDGSNGQFLTVDEPGTYWCTVDFLDSTNLVSNGDFSEGNSGFSTDYVWGTGGPWGILSEEGTYVIGSNAGATHVNFSPCVDHTTGNQNFMIVNGDSTAGENVWCQTVDVEANTDYYFSGWFTSVHPANPAILSYFINETIIETVYLSSTTCLWQNFVKEWNSGVYTSAEICIINQNTELGGNDFGIDDIHLLKYCPSSDTIVVAFESPPTIELGNDTVLCQGEELVLSAGPGYASYLWSNGSVDSVLVVDFPGIYWVEVTSINGCTGSDTLFIQYAPAIEVNLGSDTTLCAPSLLLDAGEGFVSYTWSNNVTSQTNLITQAGLYWVIVEDENGCSGSDTIIVDMSAALNISLGSDTSFCSGMNYTLSPGSTFASYLWQNGSTLPSFPVSAAGTYWVIVTDDSGCQGSDTVSVDFHPLPVISLGTDTTICTGQSLFLDPGSQYSSYIWQDNSTLPYYNVTTTGQYHVTVMNQFDCSATDEIFVQVTSPEIDLGSDTLLCLGDTILLNPGQGYSNYLWHDNSTDPTYPATTGGIFSVIVTDNYDCFVEESIEITSLAKPVAELGGDQDLCEGNSLVLETIQGPFSYEWNGVPGYYYLEVQSAGTYEVNVSNQCGSENDEIVVTEFPVPVVYLGPDQVILPGESLQLNAGEDFDQYIWQDGANGQFYAVTSDQADPNNPYYWVEVWDGPCKSSDTIVVELFDVKVPNLITPNGDGANDVFIPIDNSWGGVTNHHIDVFNRWGEKVWESDNFAEGWDGKRNGKFVAEGTYYWILEIYHGENNTRQQMKGTLTILGESD